MYILAKLTRGHTRRGVLLRTAAMSGLMLCALFWATNAWAEPTSKTGPQAFDPKAPYSALGKVEPGKAEIFSKPAPGGPDKADIFRNLIPVEPGKAEIFKMPTPAEPTAGIFKKPTPAEPAAELNCLALNIYFEARSEPEEGKLAVGHVVMNRVVNRRFPSTVCGVVRQGGELRRHRCQFSWWCDGRSDKPRNRREWQKSSQIALSIYWGQSEDPTDGALWYHADYVKPGWRKHFERGPKIGRHIFYRAPAKTAHLITDKSADSFLAN